MRNQGEAGQARRYRAARWLIVGSVSLCLMAPLSAESPRFSPRPYRAGQADPGRQPPPAQGSAGLLGLHSEVRFSLLSARRQGNEPDAAAFQAQVRRVAARLQAGAQKAYPEACERVGSFDVFVTDSKELSTLSSGTGKIAVSAGFARLKPGDAWLAFVIAREMGHVVAGHHDSNAGASIAVSLLMNLALPGSGLLKSAISFGGSEIASGSRRERQGQEADDAAIKVLEAAGYGSRTVARSLRQKPLGEEDATNAWAADFHASMARLAPPPGTLVAQGRDMPPQPARGRPGVAGSTRLAASAANVVAVSYKAAEWSGGGCGACGAQP